MIPKAHEIEIPEIADYTLETLENGAKLYILKGGSQDVIQLDVVTNGGGMYSDKAMLASAVAFLSTEGSKSFTSQAISEKLDFYGAYLSSKSTNYHSILSLLCITKHFEKVFPCLEESLKKAIFPQVELEIYRDKIRQELAVDLQTPNYLARRRLRELIYEENSRFARRPTFEALDALKIDDILSFYNKYYTPENLKIFVTGKPTNENHQTIRRAFSTDWCGRFSLPEKEFAVYRKDIQKEKIEMKGATQMSIAMGRELFTFNHKDDLPFKVLNCILGGYFGSRLMTNIREKKGLTYGIYSQMINTSHMGMHCIFSDVNKKNGEKALKEISHELQILQQEKVENEELKVVKNYMRGEIIRQMENVFLFSEALIPLHLTDSDATYYDKLAKTIDEITPENLQKLAQKYFDPDKYHVVLAG